MTNAELKQIEEIKRVREALDNTNSRYLRRDYTKYLNRLIRELNEYRQYQKVVNE